MNKVITVSANIGAHRYRMAKKHARMASKKLKTMFRMGKLRNAKEVVAPMDGERELIRNVTMETLYST